MSTSDEMTLDLAERLRLVPLPELFKEKLLALVSRYCTAPYSLIGHSCALAALGMPAAEILALLERPAPSEAEIERDLAILAAAPAPLGELPPDGSILSEALLRAALHFFLNRDRAARCRAALRRLLGDVHYDHLMALLAHAKASHVWIEAHPELSHEQDPRTREQLPALLAAEPRLEELFRTYRERARRAYRRLEEQLVADIDRHRHAEEELRRRVTQLQTIYQLHDSVSRAEAVEEIYNEALEGLRRSLNVDRASILLFDADGVMRFKSWRGLSDDYRRVMEGHSPWAAGTSDPEPLLVEDVDRDAGLAPHLPVLRAEGIRALAFIPLSHGRSLLGKFMLYYDRPHAFTAEEVRMARNIAGNVGFAIARRQAEEERERLLLREQAARAQAEEASRAKDDFLATISHELRTPLTAILAWPVILRAKGYEPQAVARGLQVIDRNARLQAQIIDDLLEVSRIVTGKLRLNLRPLELTHLLEAAVETVRSTAEAKGVRLRTVLDEPAGPVLADPDRLQQVLWNLISNAVKFTPAGGSVEVRLHRTATSAEVTVSDDGMGISPEFLPHVF
ncbi:MAG TPA: GAF domain-containing sensor histidine kinase, partial [Thermoanaerobaculia bacterium]|nr:GAF domain-containing sensor histidine kinase [Thermoanaerobaculia bacterium]